MKTTLTRIFACMLAVMLCFTFVACQQQPATDDPTPTESAQPTQQDTPTETEAPTATDTPTAEPTPTEEPKPTDYPKLPEAEQVKKLNMIGDEPAHNTDFSENFEGEDYDDDVIFSFSDINIVDTTELGGNKAIHLAGGERIIVSPSKAYSGERVVVKFKIKIDKVAEELPVDGNFQYANELFHLCADESGRIGSSNYYSAKFRILQENAKQIRFFGYLTDIGAADSMGYDADKNPLFDMYATYDVELTFEPERCFIDINDGQITANFGNTRDNINDFVLYARQGVDIYLDDIQVYETDMPEYEIPENIQYFLDNDLMTGFIDYYATEHGVFLERLSHEQRIRYGTSTLTQVNTCTTIDVFTNTKNFELTYKVMESGYSSGWDAGFDVFVNGVQQDVPYQRTVKNNVYTFTYTLPAGSAENNRLTIYFPPTITAALLSIRYDEGAKFAPVPKNGKIICVGDSITEGSGCISGAAVYMNHIARAYNLELLNQAVSGWSFDDCNIMGDYENFKADYVFIANGTNNFAGGHSDKENTVGMLEILVDELLTIVNEKFPDAKIFGLAPIYREDEIGTNFNLRDVNDALMTYYGAYDDVVAIDCYEFCPGVAENFFGFMLHPSSLGHNIYGQNLLNAVKDHMGIELDTTDWQAAADEALK